MDAKLNASPAPPPPARADNAPPASIARCPYPPDMDASARNP